MSDLFGKPKKYDVRRDDVIDELKRELAMRRSVYPRWIVSKKIDDVTAHWRILVLEVGIDLLESVDPDL